jgi:hypothetical protein
LEQPIHDGNVPDPRDFYQGEAWCSYHRSRTRPQSRATFLTGLALYEARPDKGYSLADCVSMEAMRQESITEILAHDNHFAQEGFTTLL